MASKTWKLGEVCQGGVITVETKGTTVSIIGKEWDVSAGFTKGSNQSQAKEFTRREINSKSESSFYEISEFLNDLTTSYHADNIIEWIESKVKLAKELDW